MTEYTTSSSASWNIWRTSAIAILVLGSVIAAAWWYSSVRTEADHYALRGEAVDRITGFNRDKTMLRPDQKELGKLIAASC